MAALMDGFVLASVPTQSRLLSVEIATSTQNVVASFENQFINVYNINDQKLLESWSVPHGVTVTCPAVWSSLNNNYICVLNKQQMRLWSVEEKNLDKAKKKHVKSDIYRVFTIDSYQPIVLCRNGSVEFIENIKSICEQPVLQKNEEILFCELVEKDTGLCLIYIVNSEEKKVLHCQYFCNKSKQWNHQIFPINYKKSILDYCCYNDEANITLLFIIGVDKNLYRIEIKDSGIHEDMITVIQELSSNINIKCLDSTQLLIAGLHHNKQDGIGIFDIKYCAVQSFKPFPESYTTYPQVFCVHQHIFLSCGKNIYAFPFILNTSTLAEFLGKSRNIDDAENSSLHVINWSSSSKNKVKDAGKHLEYILANLLDPSKTPTHDKFKFEFNKFLDQIQKGKNSSCMSSLQMIQLCQRCLTERKFWPHEEIRCLIINGMIPSGMSSELLNVLVEKGENSLLHLSFEYLLEISENSLIHVLQYYLSQSDDEFNKDMLPEQSTVGPVDKEKCPFRELKSHFICRVINLPFSDIFLINELRRLDFQMVLVLLEFLFYLMTVDDNVDTHSATPKLQNVIDWISYTIDVHVTQLILSPDARVLLIKLHEVVTQQTLFFDGMIELEAVLSQFHSKLTNPVKQNIGQYCIEVLHIY